jgi:predicted MFS family arabinose efflux permease
MAKMPSKLTLSLLAVGTFAIGTDGFILSGILPKVASSLSVSTATAGQLLTIFTIVYAIAAPVLAAVLSDVKRRALLVGALALFVVANLIGAFAGAFWVMACARVLAALGAAAYLGPAVAVAASVVPREFRGRAYAVVVAGLSVATALGLPLGSLVGQLVSWRLTLLLVALIALLALGGLAVALPETPQPPAASLAARVRAVSSRPMVAAFGANMFVAAGAYGIFAYIAPITSSATTLTGAWLTFVLHAWGVTALPANILGGRWSDQYSAPRVFRWGVVMVIATLALFGLITTVAPRTAGVTTALFLLAVIALSAGCWGLQPAQANRIMELAPGAPQVAVSFSSSATYLGVSIGTAVQGLVLSEWSFRAIGWIGALLALGAIACIWQTHRQQPPAQ